jgi:hypothetical protein
MDIKAFSFLLIASALGTAVVSAQPGIGGTQLKPIAIGKDGKHFVFSGTEEQFKPWGLNYDHDRSNRLLEDYWEKEWETVEQDFQEMKALGANCVRVHLQVGKFMNSEEETNRDSLERFARLLKLAELTGLYLDVTGLGCYEKKNVPKWYNDLSESKRWAVQARFWEAIAAICSKSPAIFCYDLMNEPIVTEDKKEKDWTPGEFAGKNFVQRLTLDFAGRTEREIAKAWVDQMAGAIRKHDRQHLLTVGAIPWAMTWPTAKPLFYSKEVSEKLDFVSVHFYPKSGEVDKALTALAVYDIGKPMVVEEMFPLSCSVKELNEFIEGSKKMASGWMGFYWGKTIEEYRAGKRDIGEGLTLGWLEYFTAKAPEIAGARDSGKRR